MTDPDAIRAEHETLKQRVAALALKYADEYPDLLQNYTLAILLYVDEYENAPLYGADWDYLLQDAEEGKLVNFTSLHRAITSVKRDFQTPEQRKRGLTQEEAWAEGLTMDDAEGFD